MTVDTSDLFDDIRLADRFALASEVGAKLAASDAPALCQDIWGLDVAWVSRAPTSDEPAPHPEVVLAGGEAGPDQPDVGIALPEDVLRFAKTHIASCARRPCLGVMRACREAARSFRISPPSPDNRKSCGRWKRAATCRAPPPSKLGPNFLTANRFSAGIRLPAPAVACPQAP